MAYIEVIEHNQAEGRLKEIYDDLVSTRGKLASVHKIQSLNPESIVNHMDLYMTIMFGKSKLKRQQREMIAVVVSAANKCHYCQIHHAEALNHYWKNDERIIQLRKDYTKVEGLTELEIALCNYAYNLTVNTVGINEMDHIEPLKKLGLDDKAVLDAALIISYFNFVNRMIIGLGVSLENDGGSGYKY